MDISPVFFYILASLAIAFSLLVVLKSNPVTSAFALVMVFFSFAGIYALMSAHLIAILQILVYAGAIMVLFVFVIMLLNVDVASLDLKNTKMSIKVGTAIGALLLLACLIYAQKASVTSVSVKNFTPDNIVAAGGNTQVVSELMFSEYILPFELTSVLLLAAIVGAVAIAKRKRSNLAGDKR